MVAMLLHVRPVRNSVRRQLVEQSPSFRCKKRHWRLWQAFSEDGHWSTRTAVVKVWAAVALQFMRCLLWPHAMYVFTNTSFRHAPEWPCWRLTLYPIKTGESDATVPSTQWPSIDCRPSLPRPISSVMRHAKVGILGVSIAKVPPVARLHNSNCWCSTSRIKNSPVTSAEFWRRLDRDMQQGREPHGANFLAPSRRHRALWSHIALGCCHWKSTASNASVADMRHFAHTSFRSRFQDRNAIAHKHRSSRSSHFGKHMLKPKTLLCYMPSTFTKTTSLS